VCQVGLPPGEDIPSAPALQFSSDDPAKPERILTALRGRGRGRSCTTNTQHAHAVMPVESFAQPAPSTVPRRRPFGPVHRCGGTETVLIILRDTPLNPCERPVKHHYHSRYTTSLTSNPNQARDIHLTSPHHIPPSLLSDGPLSIPLSAPSQPPIQCVRIHTHNLPDPTLWNALF